MSERTKELESRLTGEWQTVAEIAMARPGDPVYTSAWRVLSRMERQGDAEKRIVRSGGRASTVTYWRLVT